MTFPLLSQFNPETGEVFGASPKERRLDSLQRYFLNQNAFQQALLQGNPVIYSVTGVEPAQGDGQLHYGLGKLMPGKIGVEYYFTAGHLHAHRPAAEFYIGLSGDGLMLLQHELTGETQVQPLKANTVVYVPGYTAHRTVNCGTAPLLYIGVYPAEAGHDYGIIAERNFDQVVIEVDGHPVVMDRLEATRRILK
jgi:glucose-6-phosphate isomerase, archaeal